MKLTVSTANLSTPHEQYQQQDTLFDGQSKETLAFVNYKGDRKSGIVFDSSLTKLLEEKKQSSTDYQPIAELIDSFVETDRKP